MFSHQTELFQLFTQSFFQRKFKKVKNPGRKIAENFVISHFDGVPRTQNN